jgi:(1->4)-alpha-D-glucan 1-alpha-D-glucosylmutase
MSSTQARIPVATYRLQFTPQFTFNNAAAIVNYLHELGITSIYASPIFAARHGSTHGYDITDHGKLNSDLGNEEDLGRVVRALQERQMGLIMDVVPNHMCIAGSSNRWWNDVLENGPSSSYASHFDIDWHPPKPDLINKVLLPVLGDQWGRILERQDLKVFGRRGAFFVRYYDARLPIGPESYALILTGVLEDLKESLGEYHPQVLELESIMTAIHHLPPRIETDRDRLSERRREKEIIKRRLATLHETSSEMRAAIKKTLIALNGKKGEPRSFDRLEELIDGQSYRLSYWRVAADEINYRRFFDINELAAIRVEEPRVFAAVHDLVFRLIKQGWVTGLRIDHVDGLLDPRRYLRELQQGCLAALAGEKTTAAIVRRAMRRPEEESGCPFYVLVEKILGHAERLRNEWPVHGTTGYDFMADLNGVFVDQTSRRPFLELYARLSGQRNNFADLVYECKKLILRVAMSSELQVLARKLDRISEQQRYSRDFTFNSLHDALGEVIASFPVYRSYTNRRQSEVGREDEYDVILALWAAKRRNPATSHSIFDFISSLLRLEDPENLTEAERAERRDFVVRFQQLTGPVMAKGLEDTAFYRFFPLASLNEVGSHPETFGVSLEDFHERNQERCLSWPHALSATSTHDVKRGEDVRARLNTLSEMPGRWYRVVRRWRHLNAKHKSQVDGYAVPDANEEYLLYQTLVGCWPLGDTEHAADPEFVARIAEYMIKAVKEGKIHSSWISPNDEYEQAIKDFVHRILDPATAAEFLDDLIEFVQPVSRAGILNSLSQTLIKITAPGIPDFYQGTELWDFNLVDPDNRRAVDFGIRQSLLASIRQQAHEGSSLACSLLSRPEDGAIKMFLIARALGFRHRRYELFESGSYQPVKAVGQRRDSVIAFERALDDRIAVTITGRFFTRFGSAPMGEEAWGDTAVELPGGTYRDVLTGRTIQSGRLGEIFSCLPIALLEKE